MHHSKRVFLSVSALFFVLSFSIAQTVQVGDGNYTTIFPGTDEAGRNGFPPGQPQLTGNAVGKPVPTNDWWSKVLLNNHADNLFSYPFTMKTVNNGLTVNYIARGVIGGDLQPIEVGVSGLNASQANVSDYSDWTVTFDWDGKFQATSGIGMPFLYFNKGAGEEAQILVRSGTTTITNEMLLIENAGGSTDYAVYAPTGSTWSQTGDTFTSTLNGQNYWSLVMLPHDNTDASAIANTYKKYAYVFPSNTIANWTFDELTSVVRTEFIVETDVKEGAETTVLQGLLPHQWSHLASNSAVPEEPVYNSVRGDLKMLDGNTFAVENIFRGILPTLPYLNNYSDGFSLSAMGGKVSLLENDQLATWTDSYNEGQVMNRLIQTARIADKMGNIEARDKMLVTIKERLEDWLTVEGGEVAFLFYYNSDWTAMIGYPAGHGQDNNINDHHFHWGYFIHAAAFLEQFEPGWAEGWGDMINLLVRDAASPDRDDSLFPFLRNFSPYAGHCWANGFASFPQGNDQESTSESMQFNSSLIHWGMVTGNDEIRDLGIYLYTTEQSAVEEYWFDIEERIFPENQYSLVSRVWGNDYDNGTFFTADIAASYGIELYPIHGGSMYLGHDIAYSEKLWTEIEQNTGILENEANVNLWHDIMYQYLSFTDPAKAILLYDSNQDRELKFGVSDALTYYWIHSMNAIGQVDASVTADYPLAVAFQKEGIYTYAAHNYSALEITVTFSDGFELIVPARSMATNRDVNIDGVLTSSFSSAYPGGSVDLTLATESEGITKVEFYNDGNLIGEDLDAPYELKVSSLIAGVQGFYAKMYEGENFDVSNIIEVTVGSQTSYSGAPSSIPGVIEAGHYDKFEGAKGQGIAYLDLSPGNNGDFRTEEDVDSELSTTEGATIGWISGGEWVEYTIDVQSSNYYELSFRFASDNQNGGGPFRLEIDGDEITDDISATYTTGWATWETMTVSNIPLHKGEHVLRIAFYGGEFNIARMTFSVQGALSYGPPLANAGENIAVILPASTTTLDGSLSSDPDEDVLTFSWEQLNGPSVVSFSDPNLVQPLVSNLEKGIYTFKLVVSDGVYNSSDQVLVVVSETGNLEPSVSITSPANNASFREGESIEIAASASDLEGDVVLVEFYSGVTKLGEDATSPFNFTWEGAAVGNHSITAVATDEDAETGTSQDVNISVEEVQSCTQASDEAQEGNFSVGYRVTYESAGNSVTVIFEMLDDDKVGLQAYLRDESINENQMEQISDRIFAKTFNGLEIGSTITYACKFDFSGGLAVTNFYSYEVGTSCEESEDTTAPTNFTATVGAVTFSSISLVLNGTEESSNVIYRATYGSTTKTLSAPSGDESSLVLNGLSENTTYEITVTASDLAGNEAANSPIVLSATTTADTNTDCLGTDFQAQEGSFSDGYAYSFETNETDVTITFELFDDKPGVFAFLWKQNPFTETQMTLVSGKKFTSTLTGLSLGTTINYACKFEFEGGLAVTKYFTYLVGDECDGTGVVLGTEGYKGIHAYPNPVSDDLTIDWIDFVSVKVFSLAGQVVMESSNRTINVKDLESGIYLLNVEGQDGNISSIRILKE